MMNGLKYTVTKILIHDKYIGIADTSDLAYSLTGPGWATLSLLGDLDATLRERRWGQILTLNTDFLNLGVLACVYETRCTGIPSAAVLVALSF